MVPMPRFRRVRRCRLLAAAFVLIGCGRAPEPRLLVGGYPPREWTYPASFGVTGEPVTGEKDWYSARDLDRIVRAYVRENGVRFDFRGKQAQFMACREGEHMASGMYVSGMGQPVLAVDIGRDGHVKRHYVGVTVCALSIGEAPPAARALPAPRKRDLAP